MVATPRALDLSDLQLSPESLPDQPIPASRGCGGYEEYHPFGTTSWHAHDSTITARKKRYRYTGKEKDEETGLSYHGARYYAPWLGRWCSADPAGMVDGPNRYAYVRNNPVRGRDPSGTQSLDDEPPKEKHGFRPFDIFKKDKQGPEPPPGQQPLSTEDAAALRSFWNRAASELSSAGDLAERQGGEAGLSEEHLAEIQRAVQAGEGLAVGEQLQITPGTEGPLASYNAETDVLSVRSDIVKAKDLSLEAVGTLAHELHHRAEALAGHQRDPAGRFGYETWESIPRTPETQGFRALVDLEFEAPAELVEAQVTTLVEAGRSGGLATGSLSPSASRQQAAKELYGFQGLRIESTLTRATGDRAGARRLAESYIDRALRGQRIDSPHPGLRPRR